MLTDVY